MKNGAKIYKNVIFSHPDGKVSYVVYNEKDKQYKTSGKRDLHITKDGIYSYVAEVIYKISKTIKGGKFSVMLFNDSLIVDYSLSNTIMEMKECFKKGMIDIPNYDYSKAESVFIRDYGQYSKLEGNLWYSKKESEEVTDDMVFESIYEKILIDFFEGSLYDTWYTTNDGKSFQIL